MMPALSTKAEMTQGALILSVADLRYVLMRRVDFDIRPRFGIRISNIDFRFERFMNTMFAPCLGDGFEFDVGWIASVL